MQVHHSLAKHPVSPTQTVLAHFDDRKTYDGMRRYGDSKLVMNAFCRRLATIVSSDEVIVNNVCPGMVATGLDKGLPVWLRTIMSIVRKFMARTVEEGGRALIYAAIIAGPETHGKFIQNNKVDPWVSPDSMLIRMLTISAARLSWTRLLARSSSRSSGLE
jgi:NAD(P)-dependent dehydrogenase (short-subunit alcohol dehydrogenase family)